jgi:rhamnosyltransferase
MVDIIMACYNGADYINIQITSIINQTFKDWDLYIHDDGSSDETIFLIKEWTKKDSRIHFIDDNITHLGVGRNFLYALKFSNAEYVCFCDQDDYWFENKLDVQYNAIKKLDNYKPILVISSVWPWQYPSNNISFYNGSRKKGELKEIFFGGGFQGCASIFNVALKKYLLYDFKNIWMHDMYMSLVALTFGKVVFIDTKLALYRRHDKNATKMHLSKKEYLENIIFNINKIPVTTKLKYENFSEFYNAFEGEMKIEDKKLFEIYLVLPKLSRFNKLIKIISYNFSLGHHGQIKLLLKIIFKKYYIK